VGRVLVAAHGWEPAVEPRLDWGEEPALRLELLRHADEISITREELEKPSETAESSVEALELALPPVARALAAYPGADANGLRLHAARLIDEEGYGVLTGAYLIGSARRLA